MVSLKTKTHFVMKSVIQLYFNTNSIKTAFFGKQIIINKFNNNTDYEIGSYKTIASNVSRIIQYINE